MAFSSSAGISEATRRMPRTGPTDFRRRVQRRDSSAPAGATAQKAPAASAAVLPQGAGFSGDRGGQMKRGPRKTCFAGKSSTFHRRKVDRKAAGGPLYQGRNAPRSPPFAHAENGFCCTPAPRLPRGFALPCGERGFPLGGCPPAKAIKFSNKSFLYNEKL